MNKLLSLQNYYNSLVQPNDFPWYDSGYTFKIIYSSLDDRYGVAKLTDLGNTRGWPDNTELNITKVTPSIFDGVWIHPDSSVHICFANRDNPQNFYGVLFIRWYNGRLVYFVRNGSRFPSCTDLNFELKFTDESGKLTTLKPGKEFLLNMCNAKWNPSRTLQIYVSKST